MLSGSSRYASLMGDEQFKPPTCCMTRTARLNSLWVPNVAPSIESREAEIRAMTWEESQEWCNFVLMKPTVLPAGVAVETSEMRPESPPGRRDGPTDSRLPSWTLSNPACHRCVLAGKERRVRIKQYLYDWAPPAFDCPCLWLSPVVRHFFVGNDVGWLGTDFRGLAAHSVNLDRTTVELSVLEGSFSDDELQEICRGLHPVSPGARKQVLDTPLATLCYQSRHEEQPIAVPVGFWRTNGNRSRFLPAFFLRQMYRLAFPEAIFSLRRNMATNLTVFSHTATWRIRTRRISFITNPSIQTSICASWFLWRMLEKQAYLIPLRLIGRLVAARRSRLRAEPFTTHSAMRK